MKTRTLAAVLILACIGSSNTWAQTACRVKDPTGTPLNVRTAPNGGHIVTALGNGTPVSIMTRDTDNAGRLWVYVANSISGNQLGWVFRRYITCGVSSDGYVPYIERAIQLARRTIVDSDLYGGSIQCLSLDTRDPEGNKLIIDVSEIHNHLCAGDPNTGPRVGSLLINLDTWDIKMEDVVNGTYVPLKYGGS